MPPITSMISLMRRALLNTGFHRLHRTGHVLRARCPPPAAALVRFCRRSRRYGHCFARWTRKFSTFQAAVSGRLAACCSSPVSQQPDCHAPGSGRRGPQAALLRMSATMAESFRPSDPANGAINAIRHCPCQAGVRSQNHPAWFAASRLQSHVVTTSPTTTPVAHTASECKTVFTAGATRAQPSRKHHGHLLTGQRTN